MKTAARIGLIGLLMLGIVFSIQAYGSIVYFDTANPNVRAGETISVIIFSTAPTDHIRMDRISDDVGGIADNLYLNPNYRTPLVKGIAVNENSVLIKGVSCGITPVSPAVSGVLYSFDYTVPQLLQGSIISIFADSSSGAINQVYVLGLQNNYVTPDSLTLTIVPEPATMLLLGLGGLLIRRKK